MTTSPQTFPGQFNTKAETGFTHHVIPELERLGVVVEDLHDMPEAGELHVTLYLPSHDRTLREDVLRLLTEFERSYAMTTTVSPMILHAEDRD